MAQNYPIITICGSPKFADLIVSEYRRLTELGYVVLMPAINCNARSEEWYFDLHCQKIALSSAIYVVDKSGFIDIFTQRLIDKAKQLGKIVYRYGRADI